VTYQHGSGGGLEPAEPILGSYVDEGRGFPSGGGGLFSTAGDYLRFAQMLLNGGELEDQRILGVKTVELMMANHLEHLEDPTITWSDSEGFGLGGSVRIDLPAGNNLGSVGQFGWYGAATTYCNIDPRENTVAILYAQHVPFNEHNVFSKFSTTFYQALVE
jgi:CubicO group peptidase (beta-lactamase class C family)